MAGRSRPGGRDVKRLKMWIARLLDKIYPEACWADLCTWAIGYTAWEDIAWKCYDAEHSGQEYCWCCKLRNRKLPPKPEPTP